MVAFADFEVINETIVRDGDAYTDRDFFQDFYTHVRGTVLFLLFLQYSPIPYLGQNGLVHMVSEKFKNSFQKF